MTQQPSGWGGTPAPPPGPIYDETLHPTQQSTAPLPGDGDGLPSASLPPGVISPTVPPVMPPPATPVPPPPQNRPLAVAYAGKPAASGVSIAALVTALLGLGPVPFVLGILALRKARQTGESTGFGTAGVVLGSIQIVIYALFVIPIAFNLGGLRDAWDEGYNGSSPYSVPTFSMPSFSYPTSLPSFSVPDSGQNSGTGFTGGVWAVGTCLSVPTSLPANAVEVACDTPHRAEVIDAFDLAGSDQYDSDTIASTAAHHCYSSAQELVDSLGVDLDWAASYYAPYQTDWDRGARTVTCVLSVAASAPELTTALADLTP